MNHIGSGFITIINYAHVNQGNLIEQFLLLTDGTDFLLTDGENLALTSSS